jgi:ABC-2 type transport system ATP-binding protein
MLAVQNLTFGYGDKPVLANVAFALKGGQTVALVGDNGAGKTTLLRCLAGLATPWSGEIHIEDLDLRSHPEEARRRLGYVRDLFGLYEEMTGRAFLRYIAATRQVPAATYRTQEAWLTEQLHLHPILDKEIRTLTRGMRQKIALAQAFVHDPQILLLDEPASGLDPDARHLLSGFLNGLRERNKTVLVSSHILGELEQYTNAMLLLKDGAVSLLTDTTPDTEGSTPAPRHHVVTLRLLEDVTVALAALQQEFGVAPVRKDAHTVVFDVMTTEAELARLLQLCMARSWPVVSFAVKTPRLADLYTTANRQAAPVVPTLRFPA